MDDVYPTFYPHKEEWERMKKLYNSKEGGKELGHLLHEGKQYNDVRGGFHNAGSNGMF